MNKLCDGLKTKKLMPKKRKHSKYAGMLGKGK